MGGWCGGSNGRDDCDRRNHRRRRRGIEEGGASTIENIVLPSLAKPPPHAVGNFRVPLGRGDPSPRDFPLHGLASAHLLLEQTLTLVEANRLVVSQFSALVSFETWLLVIAELLRGLGQRFGLRLDGGLVAVLEYGFGLLDRGFDLGLLVMIPISLSS